MPLKFQKIYADDPKRPGKRIVVGTKKTQGGKVTYISKGPVEKKKPTMSNFLATLFKPVIDRKIAGAIATVTKPLGGRVTERGEVEIDISDVSQGKKLEKTTVGPTPEFLAEKEKRQKRAKEAFEEKRRSQSLISEGALLEDKINLTTAPSVLGGFGTNLNITDLRFNRGR
jgi:hypothetical protein